MSFINTLQRQYIGLTNTFLCAGMFDFISIRERISHITVANLQTRVHSCAKQLLLNSFATSSTGL